jgi:hypothetical protein
MAQNNPQGATQNNPQGSVQGSPQEAPSDNASGEASPDSEISGEESFDENETPEKPNNMPSGGNPGASSSPMQLRSKTLLCDLATGQIIADMQIENASSAAARDNNIYVMDAVGNVSVYNLNDGTPAGKPEIRFAGTDNNPVGPGGMPRGLGMRMGGIAGNVLAFDAEGSLYAVLDGALLLADAGGNISTALNNTETSIGAPRSRVDTIFTLNDGSVIANMIENNQNNRLYKYVWNENAKIDPGKTLTIWSLSDNYFIRAAIAE